MHQAFLDTAAAALTTWSVTAVKLVSANSTACLAAVCADSMAFWLAATALLNMATALSVPAGAFFTALSTTVLTVFCTSAALPSIALASSAPVLLAMLYKSRP